mgnify:CR=1 FL=1|jgi:hypothetical protein
MTDHDLMELRNRVDAAVAAEMEKQLTAKRLATVNAELDAVIRELARSLIASRRDALRERVEAWLTASVDRMVETVARQMIDEALGEVKRRVLGRK